MFKISHMAITKFSVAPDNAGASAIFKLFQARAQLLEKPMRRLPPPAAAIADTLNPASKSINICGASSLLACSKVQGAK
jgi:hypothetical protein